jgi:hypothetical protein
MKPLVIDLNPYSREYIDRLARIKEIRVHHEQRRRLDVIEGRSIGKSLTIPNPNAQNLYKAQRAIGEGFIDPVVPKESRPTSRSRSIHDNKQMSYESFSRSSGKLLCAISYQPLLIDESLAQSTPTRARSKSRSFRNGDSFSHETWEKESLSSRQLLPMSARDHLLSLESLDKAINQAKKEVLANRRHSPMLHARRAVSPTPSGM